MSEIINISVTENIIQKTADHILSLNKSGIDFADIAVLMPSKRPALFIKKELSKKIKKSFIPPVFMTFEAIATEVCKISGRQFISKIDAVYEIYNITDKHIKNFFSNNKTFANFFDWSCEILNFIESADIECVGEDKLLNIKANAEIGYDVPDKINELLKNLNVIRNEFHKKLDDDKKTTRGYCFSSADLFINTVLEKYKKVILFNPYYLNKSETKIFKEIYKTGKLDIISKGNPNKFIALKELYKNFGLKLPDTQDEKETYKADIKFYSSYDKQSQSCLLKNIISKVDKKDLSDTIVVLPDNSVLPSVMSEIYSVTKDVNIAVGYPATQTTVFSLLNIITQAQKNKKDDKYYVKDLLSVITNPLVKNMRFMGMPDITRIIVHTIARHFDRNSKNAKFKNESFVNLNAISNDKDICEELSKFITNYWKQSVTAERIKDIIEKIFDLFFIRPQQILSLNALGQYLKDFADNIVNNSLINTYPLNLGAINIIYDISAQMKQSVCKDEEFSFIDILTILKKMLSSGTISLTGSPLKGLQVLGTLESRGLTFKNVFVLSMSEQIIPAIKESSPLIPKDILNFLGIESAQLNADIQKYHFDSLIYSAENVNLFYIDDDVNIRSRFIEELIWNKQKKDNNLNAVKVCKSILPVNTENSKKKEFKKTDEIKEILKNFTYSATNLNMYLDCKLKFYYKYILHLDSDTSLDDIEDFESRDIGTLFHNIFENTFKKGLTKSEVCSAEFKEEFFKFAQDEIDKYFNKNESGKKYLINKMIEHKIEEFYKYEISKERNFSEVLGAEESFSDTINVNGTDYKLYAKIDRSEKNNEGEVFILDYKTGSQSPVPKAELLEEDLFSREEIKKNIVSFQLPLYKYLYEKKKNVEVTDCMYYSLKETELHSMFRKNKNVTNEKKYDSFIKQLKFILKEINSDEPFKCESYDSCKCEDCQYFFLCR